MNQAIHKFLDTLHDVKGAYWISSNSSFIQYCDSNIGLFSIAPLLVIALQRCDSKVVALKSDSEE